MTTGDPFATATYGYELPSELIAQAPAQRREEARLFALFADGSRRHVSFSDLPTLVRPPDLLVANDSQVLPARFHVKRKRGGKAQVLLLHPARQPGAWVAMARPGKRVRPGDRLALDDGAGIEILDWAWGGNRLVKFYGVQAHEAMQRYGQVPLPPYVRSEPPHARERYQTVYACAPGSVAAPTAGLHFSEELLKQLQKAGIGWTTLTLHVGAGTFRPVRAADVREHAMHPEHYVLGERSVQAIRQARSAGGRIVAVGTTTLRALEDAARTAPDGGIAPAARWTDLFIHPPDRISTADILITNFHLPGSTLLMLVCAFAGTQRTLEAYREAVALGYRFYSFGDAMFIEREHP